MTAGIVPQRGRSPSAPEPSGWGLAWALPAFVFLLLLPPSGEPLVDAAALFAGGAVYVALVRFHEHRSVHELRGGVRALGEVGVGAAIGLSMVIALITVNVVTRVWALAGLDWQTFSIATGGAVVVVAIAVFEELLFRGVLLRYAELWRGSWWALAISSLLFAASHYLGGHQSLGTFVEHAALGLVCGAAYLLSRRLWMPIGIHLGVNLGVALYYGWPGAITPLLVINVRGDQALFDVWRTAIDLAFAGALLLLARRRGLVVGSSQAWQVQSLGHLALTEDSTA